MRPRAAQISDIDTKSCGEIACGVLGIVPVDQRPIAAMQVVDIEHCAHAVEREAQSDARAVIPWIRSIVPAHVIAFARPANRFHFMFSRAVASRSAMSAACMNVRAFTAA